MGGEGSGRRLLGAAALSLTTLAAASGVLVPTAASATEQSAVVAVAPFLKWQPGAFEKYQRGSFLKPEASALDTLA
jgi:hypothetical protein